MDAIDQNKQNAEKLEAALTAVKFVKNNDVVGLGTGSTAAFAIKELAKRMQSGLKITAVASSKGTEDLAISLGIPMLDMGKLSSIDISIDGADEFTTALNLIKGGGGALFREKIMASLSKNSIIITDASKKVDLLGAFKVPVEIMPLALQYVLDQIGLLNGKGVLREKDHKIFITDNGNYIVDVDFGLINEPEKLAEDLNQIDGLLAHGIFVGLASKIIMSDGGEIVVFDKTE
jgi:ribose 5-phosphate isomerase A